MHHEQIRRHHQSSLKASTLAEVLIGMAVLTLVVIAVLGILIQTSYLEQTDTEQTQVLALAEGLMEERVDETRVLETFRELESVSLTPCVNPDFLYEQVVTDMPLGMKKISISIFYADPNDPTQPDTSKSRGGHALTLSVAIAEPTT
jgi:hypothetical protein